MYATLIHGGNIAQSDAVRKIYRRQQRNTGKNSNNNLNILCCSHCKANGKVGGKIYWVSVRPTRCTHTDDYYNSQKFLLVGRVKWSGHVSYRHAVIIALFLANVKAEQQWKFQTSFMLFTTEILSFLCLCFTLAEDISSDLRLMM